MTGKITGRKSKSGGMMKTLEYTAIVWKEEKGYVSKCPELGVASCGDIFEEAVELYIENARELDLMDDIKESLTAKEKFTARFELVV